MYTNISCVYLFKDLPAACRQRRQGRQTRLLFCEDTYEPVCSVCGVTYNNTCIAEHEHAAIKHDGECEGMYSVHSTGQDYQDDQSTLKKECKFLSLVGQQIKL